MRSFFKSYHCESRFHCKSCRDIDSKNFRSKLLESFDDIKEINFECPFGVAWSVKGDISVNKESKSKMLSIDIISEKRESFCRIEGMAEILKTYDEKKEEARCSSCFINKTTRGASKFITNYLASHNDYSILEGLDEDLVIADGRSSRTIANWKKIIDEQLSSN